MKRDLPPSMNGSCATQFSPKVNFRLSVQLGNGRRKSEDERGARKGRKGVEILKEFSVDWKYDRKKSTKSEAAIGGVGLLKNFFVTRGNFLLKGAELEVFPSKHQSKHLTL